MTDKNFEKDINVPSKEIIIDGVDVSGCKHYKHNDKNSGWSSCTSKDEDHIHAVNPLCCEKKDCLYKQLKRKEQKLMEAKLMLETIVKQNKIYPLQNNLLKLLDIIEGKENE